MKKVSLLEDELKRYNDINKYQNSLITEQTAVPEPAAAVPGPDAAVTPEPAPTDEPAPAPDAADETTPEKPEDTTADDTTQELDITDLVNMTKSIKKDVESKNDNTDVIQKMDSIFSKLDDLEGKLESMNELVNKIDSLSSEIKEIKPKSEVEKLEMRSLDSYPYNEKPREFFADKQEEMKKSGKNEYILTKDDIENYGKNEIIKTFNPDQEDDEQFD